MKKTVPFNGTKEQEEQLKSYIKEMKDVQGNLIPIMQKAQEIYGYLPIEVQTIIAREMDIPLEKVYGISTFYAMFSLEPKGKYQIAVCLGTACYVKGSQDVFNRVSEELKIKGGGITPDGKFSLDATRCLGCCGLAPVMTVNSDVYGRLTPAQVPEILKKYQNA